MKKILIAVLIIISVACALRVFVLQSYKSTSISMEECIDVGDYFLVNKFIFGRNIPIADKRLLCIREPRRGDVIVFAYPADPGKDCVMRVIGIPGDDVAGIGKMVYVNGKSSNYPFVSHRENDIIPREQNPRDNFGPVKVPANALFVMGDNRDRSYDSRFWGCVPYERIKGLAVIKYWSRDSSSSRVRWERIGRLID